MRVRSVAGLAALLIAGASAAADKTPFGVRRMVALDRLSSPTLSPDGRFALFAVRQADVPANKAKTGLWIENLLARDAAPPVRFTDEALNVNSPSFAPDGKTVYFLSAQSGSMQLWARACQGLDGRLA